MKTAPTPPRDLRDDAALLRELRGRAAGFVPELALRDGSADGALAAIYASYAKALLTRLDRAPEKNLLAFFDVLGVEPTAARAARVPIVFQLAEKSSPSAAPAGTPVAAAPPPGVSDQIVFETERAVGIAAGQVAQVVSLWPGRDAFVDHSIDYRAGRGFRTFAKAELKQVDHVLYLSHEKLLALSGATRLSLEWQLTVPGTRPLDVQWEYWDGKIWREFLELNPSCLAEGVTQPDSTAGLSRSGRIELRADGAKSERSKVAGIEGHWLRGRLVEPLPPDRGLQLPEVDAIRVASTVEQPLTVVLRPRVGSRAENLTVQLTDEMGLPIAGAAIALKLGDAPSAKLLDLVETNSDGRSPVPGTVDVSGLTELRVTYLGITAVSHFVPGETLLNPRVVLHVDVSVRGLDPDKAVGEGTKLDVTKPFYPFGQQPQPGAAFYFASQEALTKSNGTLRVYLPLTRAPSGSISSGNSADQRTPLTAQVAWEYWNGRRWAVLVKAPGNRADGSFLASELIEFVIPADLEVCVVNDTEAPWIRARLLSGGFGYTQEVTWAANGATNKIAYVVHQPPVAAGIKLAYSWQYGPFHLERVLSYNDFRYTEHTNDARWPGSTFAPFRRVGDETPALYLGFDQKPPSDVIGLFFDIEEQPATDRPPELIWEYWNGFSWQRLSVEDETQHLRFTAIASFVAQSDSAALDRFGRPLYWVRLRAKLDGTPAESEIAGLHPNAVWASQQRTLRELAIGQSDGSLHQTFSIAQVPILTGERIEVRELFGPRAHVEWRIVALELFEGDQAVLDALEEEIASEGQRLEFQRGPLRLRRDRLKRVNEVWVQWQPRLGLVGAAPDERCYVLDRATGRLSFGDGRRGRLLPPGVAIQARVMQTGGGKSGNVAARTLTQLQGGVPGVEAVFNPCAAEGGADGETLSALQTRAPFSVRHRGRAIDLADYATLAREASAAVAYARALPMRSLAGRNLRGHVSVIIIPDSTERRPFPSVFLRDQVRRFIEARAPAELAADGRITVIGPRYIPVDVTATLTPNVLSEAGQVERAARAALEHFLHPLRGGPQQCGWELGRHVFLSDVAAVLERVAGLDYVKDVALLSHGIPQGTELFVADEEIVVAGTIRLQVQE